MDLTVRSLQAEDRAAWEPLWQAYLRFYEASVPPEVTEASWARFHDPAEPMYALGAFRDGRLVGIVHYLFHRSTWTMGPYCYLQDLFTDEKARGKGVARALIEAVAERATTEGAGRLYWLTHESNMAARAVYDAVAERSGFIQYRRPL